MSVTAMGVSVSDEDDKYHAFITVQLFEKILNPSNIFLTKRMIVSGLFLCDAVSILVILYRYFTGYVLK